MSKRDIVISVGWAATVAGLLMALGVGLGLVAAGLLTVLLGIFALSEP